MTSELTPRIKDLCSPVAKETDRQKFLEMVAELNQLFEGSDEELKSETSSVA